MLTRIFGCFKRHIEDNVDAQVEALGREWDAEIERRRQESASHVSYRPNAEWQAMTREINRKIRQEWEQEGKNARESGA